MDRPYKKRRKKKHVLRYRHERSWLNTAQIPLDREVERTESVEGQAQWDDRSDELVVTAGSAYDIHRKQQ